MSKFRSNLEYVYTLPIVWIEPAISMPIPSPSLPYSYITNSFAYKIGVPLRFTGYLCFSVF